MTAAPQLSNCIRALRTEAGLTQQQLAEACGITRQTVIALESGQYGPSLELAFRIARVFRSPLESVFQWRGK